MTLPCSSSTAGQAREKEIRDTLRGVGASAVGFMVDDDADQIIAQFRPHGREVTLPVRVGAYAEAWFRENKKGPRTKEAIMRTVDEYDPPFLLKDRGDVISLQVIDIKHRARVYGHPGAAIVAGRRELPGIVSDIGKTGACRSRIGELEPREQITGRARHDGRQNAILIARNGGRRDVDI